MSTRSHHIPVLQGRVRTGRDRRTLGLSRCPPCVGGHFAADSIRISFHSYSPWPPFPAVGSKRRHLWEVWGLRTADYAVLCRALLAIAHGPGTVHHPVTATVLLTALNRDSGSQHSSGGIFIIIIFKVQLKLPLWWKPPFVAELVGGGEANRLLPPPPGCHNT